MVHPLRIKREDVFRRLNVEFVCRHSVHEISGIVLETTIVATISVKSSAPFDKNPLNMVTARYFQMLDAIKTRYASAQLAIVNVVSVMAATLC